MHPHARAFAPQAETTIATLFRDEHALHLLCTARLHLQTLYAQLRSRYHSLPLAVRDHPGVEALTQQAVNHELDPEPVVGRPNANVPETIFAEMLQDIDRCISTAHGCLVVGPLAGASEALRAADGLVHKAEMHLLGLKVAMDQHVRAARAEEGLQAVGGEADEAAPPSGRVAGEEAVAEWNALIAKMRASATFPGTALPNRGVDLADGRQAHAARRLSKQGQ
ncbi:hypothetical protein LTR36_003920 [Oleoguttula mirabilis]|uniref:Uncharacterized protein n=1 Tax=Oleoguttula mirabilis TaxID=1507867 RepID=A0AAV9JIH2_9PEZI|nr:hypothetical protein LTR36_003920 [Oleoguttula mirabilis]